jgi:tetratricopeptide (TPR) repeat protein
LFFLRLIYFLFLFNLFFFCSRFRLQRLLAPISGGIALLVFIYGILQKFYLFPRLLTQKGSDPSFYAQAQQTRIASGRIFAIFPLPTIYAMVCGLLLIFIIHYFLKGRGWQRIGWLVLLLLGGFNLFLTQSFGGTIFFTVGVLFYFFISGVFQIKYLAPLVMVLALFFFLIVALRFSEARELTPAKLRFVNWLQAGRVIVSAPLLGVGLGNYETAVPAYVYPGEPASIYAHNFFLQMAAEIGIPLLLLFLLLALLWIKKNYTNLLRRDNALFTALGILILLFNLLDVGNYFFVAGACFSVALSQIVDLSERSWRLHFGVALLLALPLLVNEISTDRQNTADLWLSRSEYARAESDYHRAIKINPLAYRALLGKSFISQKKNDQAGAERLLEKVLAIYPGQAYANYMFSQAAYRRGAYLTALVHASQAAAANKQNKEYQRWYEFIKTNFADRFTLSGD